MEEGLKTVERIRRRSEFERIYEEGSRTRGRFMTVFVLPNGASAARLGVAATRRLGSAVERNHAKRLTRELFRRHKIRGGLDVVIVPRREMLNAPFTTIEADYLIALDRGSRPHSSTNCRRGRSAHPDPRV